MDGLTGESVTFVATILLTAIGTFICSFWMLASAKTHTARNTIRVKRTTRELERDCAALDEKLLDLRASFRVVDSEEKALSTENSQIRKACAVASQDTFEIIHEIGSASPTTARFDIEVVLSGAALTEGPAASQIEPRVWALRNVAHVWATTPQEAIQMAGRAFPVRYGYVITKLLNAELPPEEM